jgi:hypothetical protein
MTEQHEIPPELLKRLRVLWKDERPFLVSLRPKDAWIAVGVIQFASRNPQLSPLHRQAIEEFGRSIQQGLTDRDPVLGPYLEMGWDPAYDAPREGDR